MRAYIGRSRTPCLVHMDHMIMTMLRAIACGESVSKVVEVHWDAGVTALPEAPGPADCDLFHPG